MTPVLAIASAIFFHRGDFVPVYEFTHFPCKIEPLYIAGLDETGTYLQSEHLYIFYDRSLFHISPRVTRFDIKDNESSEIVGEIHIRWKTDCEQNENLITTLTSTIPEQSKKKKTSSSTPSTSTAYPATSTNYSSTTTNHSIVSTTKTTNSATMQTEIQTPAIKPIAKLKGIAKKTIVIDSYADLLQGIYLYDSDGNDISHRLSHSPFQNNEEGTFFVEVYGTGDYAHIRSLMEVNVIDETQTNRDKHAFWQSIIVPMMITVVGGCTVLWLYFRG